MSRFGKRIPSSCARHSSGGRSAPSPAPRLSLQGNRYSVDPLLAGQQVELRFDPFELTAVEVKPEQIDFLAALRAEHQAHLAQELGAISFAQAWRTSEETTNEKRG